MSTNYNLRNRAGAPSASEVNTSSTATYKGAVTGRNPKSTRTSSTRTTDAGARLPSRSKAAADTVAPSTEPVGAAIGSRTTSGENLLQGVLDQMAEMDEDAVFSDSSGHSSPRRSSVHSPDQNLPQVPVAHSATPLVDVPPTLTGCEHAVRLYGMHDARWRQEFGRSIVEDIHHTQAKMYETLRSLSADEFAAVQNKRYRSDGRGSFVHGEWYFRDIPMFGWRAIPRKTYRRYRKVFFPANRSRALGAISDSDNDSLDEIAYTLRDIEHADKGDGPHYGLQLLGATSSSTTAPTFPRGRQKPVIGYVTKASTGQILPQLGDSDNPGTLSSMFAGNKPVSPPKSSADGRLPTPPDDDGVEPYVPFRRRRYEAIAAMEKNRSPENVARFQEISAPIPAYWKMKETRPFYRDLLLKESTEYGLFPDLSTGQFVPVPSAQVELTRLVKAVCDFTGRRSDADVAAAWEAIENGNLPDTEPVKPNVQSTPRRRGGWDKGETLQSPAAPDSVARTLYSLAEPAQEARQSNTIVLEKDIAAFQLKSLRSDDIDKYFNNQRANSTLLTRTRQDRERMIDPKIHVQLRSTVRMYMTSPREHARFDGITLDDIFDPVIVPNELLRDLLKSAIAADNPGIGTFSNREVEAALLRIRMAPLDGESSKPVSDYQTEIETLFANAEQQNPQFQRPGAATIKLMLANLHKSKIPNGLLGNQNLHVDMEKWWNTMSKDQQAAVTWDTYFWEMSLQFQSILELKRRVSGYFSSEPTPKRSGAQGGYAGAASPAAGQKRSRDDGPSEKAVKRILHAGCGHFHDIGKCAYKDHPDLNTENVPVFANSTMGQKYQAYSRPSLVCGLPLLSQTTAEYSS
jgi:hypothetical protein